MMSISIKFKALSCYSKFSLQHSRVTVVTKLCPLLPTVKQYAIVIVLLFLKQFLSKLTVEEVRFKLLLESKVKK